MSAGALFPIFLKLDGRKVVVVGGGTVASAKVAALAGSGAEILHVEANAFQDRDLDTAWLAIAAATPEVNRQVAAAAEPRQVFVIAVDDPTASSAYGGGVFRRGGVTVALSTEGQAPALAGLLREGFEAVLPPLEDLEAWVVEARALRAGWRAGRVPMAARRPLLLEALNRLYDARAGGSP